jgi:hypothetical protein
MKTRLLRFGLALAEWWLILFLLGVKRMPPGTCC